MGPAATATHLCFTTMASSQGISALLDAEREAQKIVQKAREYRTTRIKEARSEANKDIEAYQAKKESEFQDWQKSYSGDTSTSQEDIDQGTADEIAKIKKDFAANKDDVVKKLLERVVALQPELHRNYKTN